MDKFNFKTIIIAVMIPLIVVSLGMWKSYTTMDLVYAKKVDIYKIEKSAALQSKDYEIIRILLAQIDEKVDKNHEEIKKFLGKR